MNKVLKKVGLSAVVATFVFGLAGTSSALVPQDPDNETAEFTSITNTVVDSSSDASYIESENYSLVLDNTTRTGQPALNNNNVNGRTRIRYSKNYNGTNGEIHVISGFATAGDAAKEQKPNVKVDNHVTFDGMKVAAQGSPAGSFAGDETLSYERCQPQYTNGVNTFCGNKNSRVPAAYGKVSMGSNFNAQYADVVTNGKVENAVAHSVGGAFSAFPSMDYKINVIGADGQNNPAFASAAANMNVNVAEYRLTDNTTATSTTKYTRKTEANGYIKFNQKMNYQSKIKK